MKLALNIVTVFATVFALSLPVQAEGMTESQLLLREALMSSNADYNQHKKRANHEEFDRADSWSERSAEGIVIEGSPREELGEFLENNNSQDKQELGAL